MIPRERVATVLGSQLRNISEETTSIRRQRENLDRREGRIAFVAIAPVVALAMFGLAGSMYALVPGAICIGLAILDQKTKRERRELGIVLQGKENMLARIEAMQHQVGVGAAGGSGNESGDSVW